MAAYLVGRINVTDWEKYKAYMQVTPGVIEKFEGKFITRGGEMITLEGSEETDRVVLIEFTSLEKAKAFYNSQEYQAAKKLQAGAATVQLIAIDGT